MRIGVLILPERRWSDQVAQWRAVEDLGFDSAWTYDHLWWRSLSENPWYGAVPVLSGAAVATERVRLGLLVGSPNFRHPVPLAKDALTLDEMSGGRFTLGLGAGSPTAGDDAVLRPEVPAPGERADRFAEFVELTDQLLREPVTTYHGEHYRAEGARMIPGCVQRPRLPFAIAATGRRGMDLAARYGQSWVTLGPAAPGGVSPHECVTEVVPAQVKALESACARAGRDVGERIFVTTPGTGDPLVSWQACLDLAIGYASAGITHLIVHWPRESGVYAGDVKVLSDISQYALEKIHSL
ncbi:luciferase [Amycolatopsis coloradensis]|uniref:Luciferase n=1 Tax=Amycolatopsis coloradensis TaxID=76021 RepID=A0A1R0KR22_9PSEU|nr:LLM class flavin-dependent oxidoreductase [Amycolatopsis coloradensis]OLZ50099.1 luciferase [Amycolatopsis coloradensis]